MQRKWIIALAGAVGAILMLSVVSLILSAVSLGQSGAGEADTITVYGQGRVSVSPDIATVTLGYENSASSPQAAQAANEEQMAQITAALREVGVAEADIVPAQYNIYQEYYYSPLPEDQSYRVCSVVTVTVRKVDSAPNVIAAACNAGANLSYGITYDLADRQEVYAQALELARVRADEKAAELAESLGRRVTGIVEVREESAAASTDVYTEVYWDYDYNGYTFSDFVASGADGGFAISAMVYVTYRLD